MEPTTHRPRPASAARSPGRRHDADPRHDSDPRHDADRASTARMVATAVAIAGLLAACVGPTTGGPGGAPSGVPGGPAGSATPSPSPGTTSAPPEPATAPGIGQDLTPPGLVGRSWVTRAPDGSPVAGITGSRHRLTLPADELPIEAAGGLVASVLRREDGTGSTLRVRDIASGDLVVEAARPEEVDSAVFVGDRIVIAGHDPLGAGTDPGLAAVSLADGATTRLLASGPAPDGWTDGAARSVVASPTGRTLVSGLCLMDRCALDVIDPAGGTARRLVDDVEAFPRALTDEVVILASDDLARLEAYDLATGRRLWERSGAEFQYGYPTSSGGYVLSYVDHGDPWRFVVAVLDPPTGAERVVFEADPNDGLRLWPALSGDAFAVLGTDGRFEDVSQASPVVRASVLDLATGRLVPGGVTIVVAP